MHNLTPQQVKLISGGQDENVEGQNEESNCGFGYKSLIGAAAVGATVATIGVGSIYEGLIIPEIRDAYKKEMLQLASLTVWSTIMR